MIINNKKEKIYIIENNANVLYGLQAKFIIEGFEVGINDGTDEVEHVLDSVRMAKPDYVVLSLVLPNIDSAALLKVLKYEDGVKRPCIFAFTDLSEEDGWEWISVIGADYYFIKNEFAVDSFVGKVKKIIENRGKIGKN